MKHSTKKPLASMIEHTCLKPNAQSHHIQRLALEAKEWQMGGICFAPYWIEIAKKTIEDAPIRLVTVVGFPLGTHLSRTKQSETFQCIELGADEVDMVLPIGSLKEGKYDLVEKDIGAVVKEAGSHPVKVILETCYLSKEQIVIASKISEQSGASFIKTSTGFGTSGAKAEDVSLIKHSVSEHIGIKASGGIKTHQQCVDLIEAGATRLGMSSSVSILEQLI